MRPSGRGAELLGWVATNRLEVDRFVRFWLVGTLGTVVDSTVLNIWTYRGL